VSFFKKLKTKKKTKILFILKKNYCDLPDDVLLLSSIVVVDDARLQFSELVPAYPIADTANFLSFDVYDIDLSKVMNDSNLKFILLQTTSNSIIVVEDFDRFLTEKSTAVSLFIDVHINFPLFDFLAFKMLANSYLGLKDHNLFSQVEVIFQSGASLSSAEISEMMIANQNSLS
jgi:hypothetical protein